MNELLVISLIVLQIFVGYVFASSLLKKSNFSLLSFIPISFGVGVGIVAYLLFVLSLLSISWSPIVILVIIVLFLLLTKRLIPDIKLLFLPKKQFNFLQKIIFLFIVLTVSYTFTQAILRPLYAWDGWAIWLLKSKVFFYDGYLGPAIFHLVKDSYPFVMSLNSTFYYIFLGRPDDQAVLIAYYFFYLMTGVAIFSFLQNKIGLTKALVSSFLYLSLQNAIRHGGRFEAGYSDLALGFYIFIAILLLHESIKNRTGKSSLLFGIILGITSLIKQEGLVISMLITLLYLYTVIRLKIRITQLIYVLIGLIPVGVWIIFKKNHEISYSLYQHFDIQIHRLDEILVVIGKELFNFQNWNLLWVIYLFCIPLLLLSKKIRYELIVIISIILVYVIVFLGGPHDPAIHVSNTMNRLLLHIAPLSVYSLFIALDEAFNKFKK